MGTTALAMIIATRSHAAACDYPTWADTLAKDLDAMADDLTQRLKPWAGPDRVATPEDFGHGSEAIATTSIQAAIDHVAQAGGGTVRLAEGDYVSGTIDLRSSVRLEVAKGARLLGFARPEGLSRTRRQTPPLSWTAIWA